MPPPAFEVHRSLEQVAHDWDELAERCGAAPWLRPAWFEAWWAAFGRGRPEVVAVRQGDRLVGIVPLERSRGAVRSPSNYHTPAFGFVAEDAAALDALVAATLRRAGRRMDLKFLPAGDRALKACIVAYARAGRKILVRTIEKSPTVDTSGSWTEYERQRRGHFVRELRRRRRRLEGAGRLEFVVDEGRHGLDELLKEGFDVERSGWKGARGTAIASSATTQTFYAAIARAAAPRGWLRLGYLRLDGRAVAFDFAIEFDRVHYLLKTGYDPGFRRYAPGMLIRHEMLRRAFASGVDRYEFLGHDDRWKLEWSDVTAAQVHLQAFAPTPLGLIEWAVFRYGRPIRNRWLARRS